MHCCCKCLQMLYLHVLMCGAFDVVEEAQNARMLHTCEYRGFCGHLW